MIFFSNFDFHRKSGGTELISEKTEVLYTELNERTEVATGSYSGTGDSLKYIYSVLCLKIIGTSDQDV